MTGLTYPYTKYDRMLGDNLAKDLEFNPGTVPPSGTAGGAGRYKYWVDTTSSSLRQCIATRATAGVYVPAEWITLGVIDIAGAKFHFNTDQVDFTGGSGALTVTNLTVTGATTLNTLTVTGATTLNTLTVTGASTLHDTSINGGLSVTGNTNIGGALAVVGNISGAAITGASLTTTGNVSIGGTLGVAGATVVQNLSVDGGLTVAGNTGLQSVSVAGNLTVTGTATLNNVPYLHVTGNVDVDGAITGASLATTGAISGASVGTTGSITAGTTLQAIGQISGDSLVISTTIAAGGAINGASLNVTGAIGATSLTTTGAIGAASATITGALSAGSLSVSGTLTSNIFDAVQYNIRGSNFATRDAGVTITTILDTSGTANIVMYGSGENYYRANEHNFFNHTSSLTYAVFTPLGTANITGSWNTICDDAVKENVTPYTVGLDAILQLNPVSFNYMIPLEDGTHWSPFGALPEGQTTPPMRWGLMASNVETAIPEMVTEIAFSDIGQGLPSTPLKTIAPTHLVFVLTNAVKELDAKIGSGGAGIQELDTRVDHLEFGVTDGSEAALGRVGEYIAIPNSTGTPVSSNVPTPICHITLTAGDWEVWGSADFRPAASVGPTMIASSISTHSNALPSDTEIMTGVGILNMFTTNSLTTGQRQVLMTGQCRAKSATTLDLYMVAQIAFTGGGTILTKGYICARRVR